MAVKETLAYLRGRQREEIVERLLEGVAEGGMDPSTVPVYGSEAMALEAELVGAGAVAARSAAGEAADAPRVVVLFCHEERQGVFELLERLGARQLDVTGGGAAQPGSRSSTSAAAGQARPGRLARTTTRRPLSGYQRTWATYPGSPPG